MFISSEEKKLILECLELLEKRLGMAIERLETLEKQSTDSRKTEHPVPNLEGKQNEQHRSLR